METNSKTSMELLETRCSECNRGDLLILKNTTSNVGPPLSGGDKESTCPLTQNMKILMHEFKGLYDERLKRLDFQTRGGTEAEVLRVKVHILRSYVNDLSDQNQLLVQTVEDLEKEANRKVAFLEAKIRHADQTVTNLEIQKKYLEEDMEGLRSKNRDTKTDISTLVGVIQQSELQHRLKEPEVSLKTVPLEQVVGPSSYSGHTLKPEDIITAHVDDLRSQLKAKDRIIQNLEEEIKKSLPERGERTIECTIDTPQNLELKEVSQIADADLSIARLQAELRVAQRDGRKVQNEIFKPEKIVDEQKAEQHDFHLGHGETSEESGCFSARLEAQNTNEQEERIRHIQLRATQECLKKTLATKEHFNSEYSQECGAMRQTRGCLQNKLQSSEVKIRNLGLEVGLLKYKLQEKTEHSQQLQEQILKQQEALSRASETLKDTRKAAGSKMYKKENKLSVMQKELLDNRTLYSECHKELLLRENLLQMLKEEIVQLTAQIKEQSQDINKLNSEKNNLELEMTVVMEKHRTAQQEVNNRDQVILQLKTDLRMTEEKFRGAGEELGLHESEVSRLNERLAGLQREVRELREKGREGEERLNQESAARQHVQHQLRVAHQQVKHQTETIERLTWDLGVAKQTHSTDVERWNQRSQLLQGQLERTGRELQGTLGKAREQELKLKGLQDKAGRAEASLQGALSKVQEGEERERAQSKETSLLKQRIEAVQSELRESLTAAKSFESTSDIFQQKYQTAMGKVEQLEVQVERLEEEVHYSNNQVRQAHGTIGDLKAEILNLEGRYEEKCNQVENSDEAVDLLTEELQSTRDQLKICKDRISEREELMEKLSERVNIQHKEILEHENTFLQLQSDITLYQKSHGYSTEEYEYLQKHTDLLQKEVESLKRQRGDQAERAVELEGTIQQLKAEALRQNEELLKCRAENQGLERTLQSFHLDVASAHQDHRIALAQLEQEISQLEMDLTDAGKVSAQKDKEIRKGEDLLKKSDAELLQVREALRSLALELQHLECTAETLRGEVQVLKRDVSQKQQENLALKKLNQELQDTHKHCRESEQELAGRDERLRERAAEVAQEERSSRKARTQLRSAKERTRAAEEEVSQLWQMVEKLQTDLGSSKRSLRQALQEVAGHQQERHRAEVERDSAREKARALELQVRRHKDEMLHQTRLGCVEDMEGLTNKEQPAVSKTELGALQEKLLYKAGEVEALRTELCILTERLETATAEVVSQRQAAEESRADNDRLRRESDLVVANMTRWIKGHKVSSESLAGKIKDQNKLLTLLSTEKDHLQETIDSMEVELQKLRAENDEKKMEIEHLKAIHSHSANQQVLPNLRGHLEVEKDEKEQNAAQNLLRIENMQSRLMANMESITVPNQQLNALRGENVNQRKLLEGERARQHLEQRLKMGGRAYLSPGASPETSHWERPHPGHFPLPFAEVALSDPPAAPHWYPTPQREALRTLEREKVGALTKADIEELCARDSLDKSFWIRRVGELSAQLQESTKYWAEKMSDLTAEMEQAQISSPKK